MYKKIVILGPQGVGKTYLANTMFLDFARQGIKYDVINSVSDERQLKKILTMETKNGKEYRAIVTSNYFIRSDFNAYKNILIIELSTNQ